MYIHMYIHMDIHMYIHMKRKNLKRKSAKSYPQKRKNKRELLKASNETQKLKERAQKVISRGAKTNESF